MFLFVCTLICSLLFLFSIPLPSIANHVNALNVNCRLHAYTEFLFVEMDFISSCAHVFNLSKWLGATDILVHFFNSTLHSGLSCVYVLVHCCCIPVHRTRAPRGTDPFPIRHLPACSSLLPHPGLWPILCRLPSSLWENFSRIRFQKWVCWIIDQYTL